MESNIRVSGVAMILEKELGISRYDNALQRQAKLTEIFQGYKEILGKAEEAWVRFNEERDEQEPLDLTNPVNKFYETLPYVIKVGHNIIREMERGGRIYIFVGLPELDQLKLSVQIGNLRTIIKQFEQNLPALFEPVQQPDDSSDPQKNMNEQ